MVVSGIELHTDCFPCCYLYPDGTKFSKSYRISAKGIPAFLSTLSAHTHVLVEATANTFAFIALFAQQVAVVYVADVHQLKTISFTNTKTDKVDG